MDATYKDTVTAQLEKPVYRFRNKGGILSIIGRFSENDLKNMTRRTKTDFLQK